MDYYQTFCLSSVSSEDFKIRNISVIVFTAIEKIIFGFAVNKILLNTVYFAW
jgi:hypothetical protein